MQFLYSFADFNAKLKITYDVFRQIAALLTIRLYYIIINLSRGKGRFFRDKKIFCGQALTAL